MVLSPSSPLEGANAELLLLPLGGFSCVVFAGAERARLYQPSPPLPFGQYGGDQGAEDRSDSASECSERMTECRDALTEWVERSTSKSSRESAREG